MNLYQVYIIDNSKNNKKYIGQVIKTKGYLKRFREHQICAKKDIKGKLYFAMRKYGIDKFSVRLLEDNIPDNEIDIVEQNYINEFNSFKNGYNATIGGRGCKGYIFTSEVKSKMSTSSKNYWIDLKINNPSEYERQCQIRSQNLKGIPKSEDHKKHISQTRLEKGLGRGDTNGFYGKHHSQEVKDYIGKNNSKKVAAYNPETFKLEHVFESLKEAVNFLLKNHITSNKYADARISKICRGIDKTAYGYVWKFI